jgi:kynurenine formamidase
MNERRIVDLSLPLSAETATYPGDPCPQLEVLGTIQRDGANIARVVLSTHAGTHVDVPYHLSELGKSVDELALEAFCGSALIYDVTNKVLGSCICLDDLDPSVTVQQGEIALFYTKSNDPATSMPTKRLWTCLDTTLADWFIEKRVKAVGIDSMSVDPLDSLENEVHKKLLQNDIVIFENLSSNLRMLVGKRAIFFGMPLKLVRADASPVRAFALCERDSNSY